MSSIYSVTWVVLTQWVQSYEIKSPPWTISVILGIYSVENIDRLGDFMFQMSDISQLCIDSQYSSQQLTFVSSLKHQISQPSYIFNRIRVLHLDRLKGTWLHSFAWVKEDVNASPILSSKTANILWVLSRTLLWNIEVKENGNTWDNLADHISKASVKLHSSTIISNLSYVLSYVQKSTVSSNLLVFPFVYQFNSRIWILVHLSFANNQFRRISTTFQHHFKVCSFGFYIRKSVAFTVLYRNEMNVY